MGTPINIETLSGVWAQLAGEEAFAADYEGSATPEMTFCRKGGRKFALSKPLVCTELMGWMHEERPSPHRRSVH